jgi:hypothetical protein
MNSGKLSHIDEPRTAPPVRDPFWYRWLLSTWRWAIDDGSRMEERNSEWPSIQPAATPTSDLAPYRALADAVSVDKLRELARRVEELSEIRPDCLADAQELRRIANLFEGMKRSRFGI